MRSDLLVVVPAFNEARSIGDVVRSIRDVGVDVVVVDDGSTDETARLASVAGARVIRLPFNLGVGGALRCGFRYAVEMGYSMVVQCDADGQHEPDQVMYLVQEAELSMADLVIGSRFLTTGSYPSPGLARQFAMKILAKVASRAVGGRLTDVTSGFRLFRGNLLEHFAHEFPSYYLGDTFEATYVAGRAGYRVTEVPVRMNERAFGRSTETTWASVRLIAKVLITAILGLHFEVPRSVASDVTR